MRVPARNEELIGDGKAAYAIGTNPVDAKIFTVASGTPLYLGQLAKEPQLLVYPFAEVGSVLDVG